MTEKLLELFLLSQENVALLHSSLTQMERICLIEQFLFYRNIFFGQIRNF